MSMEQVRRKYGVPAKRGGRVRFTGGYFPELGTIKSATDEYLRIQWDACKTTRAHHPTYALEYLTPEAEAPAE